jgi:uncharacterized protein YggE
MVRSLFLGLPLLAAACAEQSPDPRGVAKNEVLLQIAATGSADTRPDQARFSAGVDTIAASAGEASSGNAAAMNRVTSALERLGIKPDDLQTRSITLQRIDYGPNRGRFQASNVVEVRVRDLPKAGEAIAAATDAGANILSGPSLTIADPEAAGRSAYANAYKAARARADAYAEAADMKVARLLAILDTGDGGPQPYYGDALMSAQTAAPPPVVRAPPVRPGVSTAQVSVRADFALAPK